MSVGEDIARGYERRQQEINDLWRRICEGEQNGMDYFEMLALKRRYEWMSQTGD